MPHVSTILASFFGAMTERIRAGNSRPLKAPRSAQAPFLAAMAALLALALIWPHSASALTHYWGRHPDKERLVVVFSETIPQYSVKRTGEREITLFLPPGYWDEHEKPQPNIFNTADFLSNVATSPDGLRITLKTNAFGYIQFPLRDRGKLVIDVFSDPIGAKWKPGGEVAQTPTPPAPAASAQPEAETQSILPPTAPPAPEPIPPTGQTAPQAPETTPEAVPVPPRQEGGEQPGTLPAPEPPQALPVPPAAETPESAPPAQAQPAPQQKKGGQTLESLREEFESMRQQAEPDPAPSPAPREGMEQTPRTEPEARQPAERQKRFFSVPYTYRARIQHKGPDEASPPKELPDTQENLQNNSQRSAPQDVAPKKSARSLLDGTPFSPSVANAAEETHSVRQSIGQGAPPVDVGDTRQSQGPQRIEPAGQGASEQTPPPSASTEEGASGLRARMAPPDTMIPVPVEAPRQAPPAAMEQSGTRPEAPAETAAQAEEQAEADVEARIDAPDEERVTQEIMDGTPPSAETGMPRAAAEPGEAPAGAPEPGVPAETPAEVPAETPAETPAEAVETADAPDAGGAPVAPEEEAKPQASVTERHMSKKAPEDPNAPPNFEEAILQARAALANEQYQAAIDLLTSIKEHPLLPKKLRGDVLYTYADALYAMSRQQPRENYSKIMDAYTEAMNDNLESSRVPDALFQLGQLNLKVDNPLQARAYFNILEKRYPDDSHIPLIRYYWGQYYYDHGDFQKAADEFQYIVQKYPDNRFVREASVGLARSLNELGYQEQAQELVDYIEKRWPRYYVEFPPLLRLYGDVNYRVGMLDKAKLNYWTYYNMDPNAEGADVVLARLGDIYLELGDVKTAKEVYEMAVSKYPEREGGLIAKMRLAEQGVYDKPSVQDMFTVFDRPYSERPVEVYKMIVEKYPNSELAPLAQLKLAMWYLWNDKLRDALDAASEFGSRFPGSELTDSAREVALKAFDKLVSQYLADQNYQGIAEVWQTSPLLKSQEDALAPETRIGLANALWKTGQSSSARAMLDPFFMSAAMPKHSENALMLAMSICLDSRNWECLTDLAERTQLWDLSPRVKEEMQYNLALAYENMDESEKSAPLWNELADREGIDPAQMAYIHYFLAHEARDKQDFKRAYDLAQSSLGVFMEDRSDHEKIKDLLALLMDVTKDTGRTREALKWAIEYSRYINKTDPEWPALRYQMAQLYRQLADLEKWRAILEELVRDKPDSLYGRMAASELQTRRIEQGASQFTPTAGQF